MEPTQTIKEKTRLMMEDMVFEGMLPREVCAKHGMSEGHFSRVRRSPLYRLEEKALRMERQSIAKKRIEALVPAAIETLGKELNNGSGAVSISAAKEILNRGGLPAGIIIEDTDLTSPNEMYEALTDIAVEKKAILDELGMTEDELYASEAEEE